MDWLRRRILIWLRPSFSDISGHLLTRQAPRHGITTEMLAASSITAEKLSPDATARAMEKTFRQMFDAHIASESRPGGSLHRDTLRRAENA